MRFRTRFSDDQIVDALRSVSTSGAARRDAGDRLQPPNLCAFFNNLPRPERDRLLDHVYPAAPKQDMAQVLQALQEQAPDDPEDSVEIRPAKPVDLPGVAMIEAESFDLSREIEGYSAAALRQLLELAPEGFLVAEDHAGRLLGYAVGMIAADRTRAWLLSLAVRPEARRQGLGRELLTDLLQPLQSKAVSEIWAALDPDNDTARRLFRSTHFADVRIARDYLGQGHDRAIMKWQSRPKAGT